MRRYAGLALSALVLLVLGLGGCNNAPPTRFYVLSTLADQPAITPGRGIAIGIGPVTLPQYLNRPQIVTRIGANQLAFAEFDQWGGDLNDNVTRVIAANLSSLLATDRVSFYPWKNDAPIDHQATIEVVNFEQDVNGSSVLTAYWSIVDPRSGRVRLMRRSSFRDTADAAPPNPTGTKSQESAARPYDLIVAAMSRNIEALSRDIASGIGSLRGR
jgi:uncharacterized protein